MKEKFLTLEQNLCAARIFLNTFGFRLEDIEEIDAFTHIKIYDKNMNSVGELHFDNGKVIITAKYNDGTLNASYNLAKIRGFIDYESNNALYGEWSSNIEFKIQNSKNTNISGEFLINTSIDSQFGISCTCHPLLKYEVPNQGNITIKILRDGLTFGAEINSNNYSERINVRPWDSINGFLLHEIRNGEYNPKTGFPYRKYVGIFNGGDLGETKETLRVFLLEEENNKELNHHSEYVPKITISNPEDELVQKGMLMKKIDDSTFRKIREIKELLLIDDISLLDNLISLCTDSYTNEEIQALLGIERKPLTFQDGSKELTRSYFGLEKTNPFSISQEQQKKLLKRKEC